MLTRTTSYNFTLWAVAILLLSGCTGIGPKTIPRDRFDYASALSNSWKRQMLLNMVKMRYADVPVFVDVASVISQYALEGEISLGAAWTDAAGGGDTQNMRGTGRYRDQPTITYAPLAGRQFAESLVKPIPPSALFFLAQGGWPIDTVFRVCVRSVNGIRNRSGAALLRRESDPEFIQLLTLLRKVQESGAVGVRIEATKDRQEAIIFSFRRKDISPEILSAIRSAKRLLGLAPDLRAFKVVYGAIPRDDKELAILTRSNYKIILELASYVDVPEEHIGQGFTYETLVETMDVSAEFGPIISIKSDKSKPDKAFASVHYQDYWFWIDNGDLKSKRALSFLLLLFSFTESEPAYSPVVTIPAG